MIVPLTDKMWCYACQRRKGSHLFSHKHKRQTCTDCSVQIAQSIARSA